ncbi:MAG: hypothetical protein AAFV54_11060, partial [Pseudomonadota bacterium]
SLLACPNQDRFRRSDRFVRDRHGDLRLNLLRSEGSRCEATASDLFETENAGLDDAHSPISRLFLSE